MNIFILRGTITWGILSCVLIAMKKGQRMDHDRKWTEFAGYDEGMGNNSEEDHNMKGLCYWMLWRTDGKI